MSYRSREKKRRAKAAMRGAVAKQRADYADRHYLTIVKSPACCNTCGAPLRHGKECVFRYSPKEILCVMCADAGGVHYRLSRRWEKANRKRNADGEMVPTARRAA